MRARKLALVLVLVLALVGPVTGCGASAMSPDDAPAEITLTIASPSPGAELVAAEHPMITVSGTVATTDPRRGALEAWVNGVRVEVVDGAFRTELVPEPGVNHLVIEGGDGIGALVGQELDVVWAPDYLAPPAGQTGFDLAGALELRLGQRFFDARLPGTALDLSTDPVVARDVASAIELILRHVDLAGLVPGGIQVGEGDAQLAIAIPSVTPSNILVDVRVVEASQGAPPALDVRIDLVGVVLATEGALTFAGRSLVVAGGVTADLHAMARLTLGIAADGAIDVGVTGVTASVGPPVPHFTGDDGEELDALIALGGNDFRTLIEGLLTDLVPAFTDRLPPLVEQLLGAADQLLDGVRFTVPGARPVTVELGGRIGALDVAAGASAGHVTVRQDLAIRASGTPIHPASRGAPRLDTSPAAPVLPAAGLQLAIRQDLLNALLHALWNAGLLEGPLSAAGLTANVSARLPPVVGPTPAASPCKIDGERCDLVIQLGQVELELPAYAQRFGLHATAGVRLEVAGGAVSLAIQKQPELRVWETSAVPGRFTPDTVRQLVTTVVWPILLGAIGDNLTIALPLPDIAALGLGDLAPGLADAQLALRMRQRPSVGGGRIVLGADLTFATPRP